MPYINGKPHITLDNKTKWQKEPAKTTEETPGCIRLEQANKWPNSIIAT
jgi:hypothetical protein